VSIANRMIAKNEINVRRIQKGIDEARALTKIRWWNNTF